MAKEYQLPFTGDEIADALETAKNAVTHDTIDEYIPDSLPASDVPDWAKRPEKPSYTAEEVGARPEDWMPEAEDIGAHPNTWMPTAEDVGARPDDWMPTAKDVGARPNTWTPSAADVGARPNTWTPTASDVGADKSGTAASAVSAHNTNGSAHNDIRLLIEGLTTRLNTLANSDDTTLDQMAEVVAYIKANRDLLDQITTGKVSVSDIVNNLTTNVTNKPLSAAQGVALKALIDAIPAWAKAASKPTYTATEVGARPNTWMPTAAEVGALPESELQSVLDSALAQAKESGEFNGERGHGILKVTTAPTSYTTAVGGKNPIKRMSLSTIKSQANVDEVLVGDQISQSYYLYHVYYLDSSYAYMDTYQSIRGAAGSDGDDGKSAYEYAQDGGYTGTEAEFAAKLAKDTTEETWTFTLADGSTVTKKVVLA